MSTVTSAPEPNDDDRLREHAQRLKKIAVKRSKGQKLTPDEKAFLGQSTTQTSYDSIGAAAAALNVEVSILRKAKRDGAPGFRGSRVYPLELLPFLNKNKPVAGAETHESLERELLKVRIQRLQFALETERRDWIRSADAAQWSTSMVAEFVKVIDAVPSTLAPDMVGLTAIADAESKLRAAMEAAKRTLHAGPWSSNDNAG